MSAPRIWFCSALIVLTVVHGIAVVNSGWLTLPPKLVGDGPDYENIAFNLSRGNGFSFNFSDSHWRAPYAHSFPNDTALSVLERSGGLTVTTSRPPLLPWLVAAIYSIIPRGPFAFAAVRLFLAGCLALGGALAVYTSVAIMRRATKRVEPVAVAGLATLALAASDRTIRGYATDFLTEPIAFLLTSMFAITLLRWLDSTKFADNCDKLDDTRLGQRELEKLGSASERYAEVRRACWTIPATAGCLFAWMIYARSLFVFWIPGVWLLMILAGGTEEARTATRWRLARLQAASCCILATVLCAAPWWVRNCYVLGRFMPLGTQGPITMLGGYSDEARAAGGDWQLAPEQRLRAELELSPRFAQTSDPVQRELLVADEAAVRVRAWIASNLRTLPSLFLSRLVTHWNPYTGRSLLWKIPMLLGVAWLIVYGRHEMWILAGLPALNTGVVMLLYTTGGRFLVPLYGILYTLAAVGIAGWLDAWLALRSSRGTHRSYGGRRQL